MGHGLQHGAEHVLVVLTVTRFLELSPFGPAKTNAEVDRPYEP
ncbi:hypothetical protein [Sinorhizobium mexicanum]|nr:hypothetical protein [Sinorhizobium mexicanum]MBP1887283.1 hypothetical protein [Sinorhizobium mexicanum]